MCRLKTIFVEKVNKLREAKDVFEMSKDVSDVLDVRRKCSIRKAFTYLCQFPSMWIKFNRGLTYSLFFF